jgi:hypothetical protein
VSANEVQGIDLGDATGAALRGASVSNATVNTSTSGTLVNTTGGAIDITGGSFGGTLNLAFTTLSSSGAAADGIRLHNTSGSVTAAAGTIQSAADADVEITGDDFGDNLDFTYGGNITDTTGQLVRVSDQTGGTKDFNGAVSGAGISLSSNAGGTTRFDGGLTLSTGSSNGLTATSGGTLAVTGSSNTLTTTTGTPLNVTNTTIHSDDLNFRAIDASDPSSSGIVLNNTGASGGLSVTGNGAPCCDSVINSAGGPGISLTDVAGGVSLADMSITGSAGDGISGSNVTGFSLASSSVTSNGDQTSEAGLDFTQLSGTAALTGVTASSNFDSGVTVVNSSGTMNLTVSGGSYSNHLSIGQDDGIRVESTGAGSHNLTVQGPITFSNNQGNHIAHVAQPTASSDSDVTITGATLSSTVNPALILGGGMNFVAGGSASGTGSNTDLVIFNNTINGAQGDAVAVGTTGTAADQQNASLDVEIDSNSIGTTGVAGSGSLTGDAISVDPRGNGHVRALIESNNIRQWTDQNAIRLDARDGDAALDATVEDNVMAEPNTGAASFTRGMTLQLGTSADPVDVCLGIEGNTLAGTGESPQPDIAWRHQGPAASAVKLVGLAQNGNDITDTLQNRNPPEPSVIGIFSADPNVTSAGSCPQPTP